MTDQGTRPASVVIRHTHEVRRKIAGHTSWMVYCRRPSDFAEGVQFEPCDPFPRVNRQRAVADAHAHTVDTGHRCEVVKVRYESVLWTEPCDA